MISEALKTFLLQNPPWPLGAERLRSYEMELSYSMLEEIIPCVKFSESTETNIQNWGSGHYRRQDQNLYVEFIPKYELYCYLRDVLNISYRIYDNEEWEEVEEEDEEWS